MKTSTSARSPLSPALWPPDAFAWWKSALFTVLLVIASLVPATLFLGFAVAFRWATITELRTAKSLSWVVLTGQLFSYGVTLAVLAAVLPIVAQRSLPRLGVRVPRLTDVAWGIAGALTMVLAAALTGAAQEAVFHLKADEVQVQWLIAARGSMIAGFVFLACIAAPVFEELVFRGFILNALLRYAPPAVAVVLSAVAFGLAHWQPGNAGAIAPLAAGGVVLAGVYYRSGSLTASMITHALFNGFTVVLITVFHQS